MGNGVRKLNHCFAGEVGEISLRRGHDIAVYLSDPLDEGLGHSFCYIRPECPSKVHSSDEYIASAKSATTTFRTISGASISANTSTPLSTALLDLCPYNGAGIDKASAFESSDSFASIPLQPIPKTSIPSVRSGPIPRSSGIISGSGPIERGFLSGPIERSFISGPLEHQLDNQLQRYKPKSKKWTAIKNLKKAISKSIVLPLRVTKELNRPNGGETVNNNENCTLGSGSSSLGCDDDDDDDVNRNDSFGNRNVQWAQGKAGEDRVHIVISEENGWVFVGIYDGFNGPDATDFLLNNLYFNVYNELKGILWDDNHDSNQNGSSEKESTFENDEFDLYSECDASASLDGNLGLDCKNLRKMGRGVTRNSEESRWNGKGRWDKERVELDSKLKENLNDLNSEGEGTVNGSDVLRALSEALKKTEKAYLETADMMVMENPELALMGSCVLVMLMKGEDVYLMNVGDSRAVLACEAETDFWVAKGGKDLERIREETLNDLEAFNSDEFDSFLNLTSQQLTVDHCTSAEEEVHRIKREHPDDASAVMNDRVKGSLKVTRAFGAGFLKQPKWNNALLETFKVDYVGTSAYINCIPSLHHHRLGPRDKFLILSSDGLYQYFTDEEAVSEVEMFISTFPEGDPAQHLVEEVLFRAAKRAGMDFHELLDIPQGDRRRYHDDVSIIIISFEGWIWRSSV